MTPSSRTCWPSLLTFWLTVCLAVASSWLQLDQLYFQPREMQQRLVGKLLEMRQLRSQFSIYNRDASGLDQWVYELAKADAARLQQRCTTPTVLTYYDPSSGFENNVPLDACIIGTIDNPDFPSNYERAVISGRLLALFRQIT